MLRETGDIVDNGFHEVYVNAQVDDNSEISELKAKEAEKEKTKNIIKNMLKKNMSDAEIMEMEELSEEELEAMKTEIFALV